MRPADPRLVCQQRQASRPGAGEALARVHVAAVIRGEQDVGGALKIELTFPASRTTVNRMVKHSSLDRTFSALSDPTRRDILERLAGGPATISELAHPYDISLPGLLKHVRILEGADLVITEKQGRSRQCRLGSEHLDDAARWIETYRRRWEGRLDRLQGYLEKQKGARS